MPDVMEYVTEKAELYELKKNVRSWERKVEIVEVCNFNLLWSEFVEMMSDVSICFYRSVEADRNVAFVSTNSLQSKLNISISLILGAMNNIFHVVEV